MRRDGSTVSQEQTALEMHCLGQAIQRGIAGSHRGAKYKRKESV